MSLNRILAFALTLGALGIHGGASTEAASRQAGTTRQAARWMNSIVSLDVSRKQYDFWQPWNTRTRSSFKTGIVTGKREILTTADGMQDRTLVRLQKDGSGEWWNGEVQWLDYHANLAIVTVKEEAFWSGLRPVVLRGAAPEDVLQIARWSQGNLELRRAEFTRFEIGEGELSGINQVQMSCDSDISGLGGGEPLIANSHCAGLVTRQLGRACTIMPASFIREVIEARQKKEYRGLGYFHWYWQPAVNTDSLAYFQLPGRPRGVIICETPDRPDSAENTLRVGDIVLQIDGFDIDISGNYLDPEYGRILLEALATRRKWAGDDVSLKIWRGGEEMTVSYRMPLFEYSNSLVPAARYDATPEYLIVGGMVFQPLTDEFLQSWGSDWKRKGPFRLSFYRSQPPTKDRPSLVILTQILPDDYSIGFQEQRLLVVNRVNGQLVSNIHQLQQALARPQEGFHVLEFMPGDTVRRLVVQAGTEEKEATERVLKRYGIRQAGHVIPGT